MEAKNILSVVMPVYNEEKSIHKIIELVLAREELGELIIIDDCSIDNSLQEIKKYENNSQIKILTQAINKGKGAAIIRGFQEAKFPFVIVQDADFEYDPKDYARIIEPLLKDKADVVYGSRFMAMGGMVRFFMHETGNKFLTFLSNIFSDIHLSDMETCYKCFKREVIQNLILTSNRFGIEVEITAKIAKGKALRIWEEPITYNPRRYSDGKKITWRDGLAALWHIIIFNCFTTEKQSIKNSWKNILKDNENE